MADPQDVSNGSPAAGRREPLTSRRGSAALWCGRVITGLLALLLGVSGIMKLALRGTPEFSEGMLHLGLPETMVVPLAIVELACALLFVIPPTAVVGAILVTGYMGGAICTHWRVGDPFFVQIGIALLAWLAVSLREPRLWSVLPWRK